MRVQRVFLRLERERDGARECASERASEGERDSV